MPLVSSLYRLAEQLVASYFCSCIYQSRHLTLRRAFLAVLVRWPSGSEYAPIDMRCSVVECDRDQLRRRELDTIVTWYLNRVVPGVAAIAGGRSVWRRRAEQPLEAVKTPPDGRPANPGMAVSGSQTSGHNERNEDNGLWWCGKAGTTRYPANIALISDLGRHKRSALRAIKNDHGEHAFEFLTRPQYPQ